MIIEARVDIAGTVDRIWALIADIEGAAESIEGIERIEILERPATGLIGCRWKETRMYFGKPATVEKLIIAAVEREFLTTRAESDGFEFLSTTSISESEEVVTLTGTHESRPLGLVARLKLLPMPLFKGMARRLILKDLNDLKRAIERG